MKIESLQAVCNLHFEYSWKGNSVFTLITRRNENMEMSMSCTTDIVMTMSWQRYLMILMLGQSCVLR